jgi:hypothetical protein
MFSKSHQCSYISRISATTSERAGEPVSALAFQPGRSGYLERMTRPGLPDSARVLIGLEVSQVDAARIDEVLARPEFTGWTRSEWCREIIRTALRYYVGDVPAPDAGQAGASARPASPQPISPGQPPVPPASASPAPTAGAASLAVPPAVSAPACPHPPDARDYDTGTCSACGAIMWD